MGFRVYEVQKEFRTFGFGIWKYYWLMVERWNTLLDYIPNQPYDGRTRKYKAFHDMQEFMCNLSDMINQTEVAHRAEVEELKAELRKWTENRGRKPLLTKRDCYEIKLLRAEGQTVGSIGRKYGVSERTIRRALNSEKP
jgi:hypothetical protein